MASSANFTLDDSEEADLTQVPVSNVLPVAQAPPQPPPATARPNSPIPSIGSPTSIVTNVRDSPKSHVDTDLGVSNLAQAAHALQENQKRVEETEALLQGLMRHQARLVAAGRLLEQQKVLDVVSTGPELGYDTGRPIAALLVYRCCLRWGCFTGDSQAAAVLDNLAALLLTCTDEDAIAARAAVAARAQAGSSSGGAGSGPGLLLDEGSQAEHEAVAAATREVAYWLAVTSILLALVDPHLPLTAFSARSAAGSGDHSAQPHHPTPLAAVAGDARASMARAASAAAAKVQELQKRMGNTFSGMQLLGKNLLMRRRASAASKGGAGSGAVPTGSGAEGGDTAAAHELEQGHQRQSSGAVEEPDAEAAPEGHSSGPVGPHGSGSSVRSPSASAGGPPEPHPPASVPLPAAASPPPGASSAGAAAAPTGPPAHSPQAFRQQLDLIVQKTYLQMRDSLKRHVSAVLPGCVQQPLAVFSPRRLGELSEGPGATSPSAAPAAAGGALTASDAGGSTGGSAGGAASSPSLQAWTDLISVLSQHLALLREAHVPRILIRCLFKQTLAFVDVQLFNQLLLRPECCCTSNARYLVAGLQLLDAWLAGSVPPSPGAAGPSGGQPEPGTGGEGSGQVPHGPGSTAPRRLSGGGHQGPGSWFASGGVVPAGEELAVLAENLRHIRQASHFLILANKGDLKLDDFTAMCPALNVQQLYRLATTFWDDSPLPPPPPPAAPAAPQSPSRAASPSREEPSAATAAAAAAAPEPEPEPEAEAAGEAPVEEKAVDEAEPAAAQEGETATEGERNGAEDMEAAAAAAVAAAAAAAAADEAGVPASPPPLSPEEAAAAAAAAAAISRNVSGEVLEEMKRRHAVANNGGLIVTFLLDEDSAPLIVQGGPGSTGAVARQLLHIINEPRLHEGLHQGLPPVLCGEDCPAAAFAFMLLESLAP